ncbi:hypothetical protein BH10CYA1_BH10CYA1_16180 [soil metagenome]
MLGTLFKALEVDFRNVDDQRYLRSALHVGQNLSRILSIRKHYPEFKAKKALLYPKLAELCKLSKKEGLCLTYWHDCSEVSEFTAVLGNKTAIAESALLASRPSRFKTASLSRFMQRGEDKVLLSYLTDVSKCKGANVPKRVFNTQSHRQQVTGLLYNLHVLEEQLLLMIARHHQKLDFTPETSFAPKLTEPNAYQVTQSNKQTFDSNGPVDIWYSLAEDPSTPYRFLVWLSENQNPYISQRALTTLQRQKDSQQTVEPVSYQTAQLAAFAS